VYGYEHAIPEDLLKLISPVAQHIWANQTGLRQYCDSSLCSYAIRDWSCPPFGAGCHAWRPEVKSWLVRSRLKAFGLAESTNTKNIHVCGEAYSDYQGFIEDALRSAADACSTI
jgi:monoamine oxidase